MSGILGIWNLDGRPVERPLLARMSATLAHRGLDGEQLWVDGPVGLGCQLSRVTPEALAETQPMTGKSGSALVFDGRLDNREELLGLLASSNSTSKASPDPELVLAAYEAFGERFAEHLNGDFALALFDPRARRLLLARDAIGVRPMYYGRFGHTFVFASEIKALLAHPLVLTRPNDDRLAEFIMARQARDGRGETFFEEIFALLPAHMAVLTPEAFATRRYWDFDPTRQVRMQSFGEYAEAFRHHFEEAVRRRLRSAYPVAVSVSGGLDSSSIFCMAETLRRQPADSHPPLVAISYLTPEGSASDERVFLAEIERAYELDIQRVVPQTASLLDGANKSVSATEFPLVDHQWAATSACELAARRGGARVWLTGHWGDQILFDTSYLVDLFRSLAWGEVRAHLDEFGRWMTDVRPSSFRKSFLRDLARHYAPESLVAALRCLRTRIAPTTDHAWCTPDFARRGRGNPPASARALEGVSTAQALALYQTFRSPYHVLCMEWNNKVAAMHGLDSAFPFLDRDLITFQMGIPGQIQTWKGAPKGILRAALASVLPPAIAERRWKADFTHIVNAGVSHEEDRLLKQLAAGPALSLGYVREQMIEESVALLKSGGNTTAKKSWSLGDLVGLDVWLRTFFAQEGNNNRAAA